MRVIVLLLIISCLSSVCQTPGSTELKLQSKPMICGHRGGFYADYPENSIEVMRFVSEQVKKGPLLLEVDVRMSKDGTLYILHDETVDRTSSGMGKLSSLTDRDINKLRLKRKSGELSDERIMPLSEVMDSLQGSLVWLMLDVKDNIWNETAALVLKKGWNKRSIFLTFKPSDTKILYDFSRQLNVSALMRDEEDLEALKRLNLPEEKLIAYISRDASTEWSDRLRKAGFVIMADVSEHTINHGQLYEASYYKERVKRNSLDILITDFPVEVSKMVK